MIRFHLDECVDHDVAHGLRARGIDITTTTEAGLLASLDETQFSHACTEQRTLITQDQDFLRLASQNSDHFGIVFAHPLRVSIGDVVRYCCLLNDHISSDSIRGRIEFVPSSLPRR